MSVTRTPTGPRPEGVVDSDAYFAAQLKIGNVEAFGPADLRNYYAQLIESESWPDDGTGITTLHPRDVAMLAVARLLQGMRWTSWDMREILDGNGKPGPPRHQKHKLEKIVLDWPEWDSTSVPIDTALVVAPDECDPDPAAQTTFFIDGSAAPENTVDMFAPGTVLRYLGGYDIPIRVIIWSGHKDIRRGLESRLTALLAARRENEFVNRVVTVPEYFMRDVTIRLGPSSRPDTLESATANKWPLEVAMTAEVEHVELVRIPGWIETVDHGVEVGGLG